MEDVNKGVGMEDINKGVEKVRCISSTRIHVNWDAHYVVCGGSLMINESTAKRYLFQHVSTLRGQFS
jgi:hypothetical protein